jgi:hypothetical protein
MSKQFCACLANECPIFADAQPMSNQFFTHAQPMSNQFFAHDQPANNQFSCILSQQETNFR